MSFERLFHWKCDFCSTEAIKASFGLPNGWDYILADIKLQEHIRQMCEKCLTNRYNVKDHKIVSILEKEKEQEEQEEQEE